LKQGFLFISDLHLSWDKPNLTQKFLRFLDQRASNAVALYILGDLFDAWVGDDDFTPPGNKVRSGLKKLVSSGTDVYLQTGNRDFLLGERFCRETGIKLLDDHIVIDLYGEPTLLMHGDLLCTDDIPYQAFRAKSHTKAWQDNVLGKPLWLRLLAARWYRFRSFFHKRKKSTAIMDVNQSTVIDTLSKYHCLRLIHGHTHRPDVHQLEINGQSAQRIVLADWSKIQGEVLVWHEHGFHREKIC
jgi:UDP-2,3-diacylglucosamine hydrolase